MSVKRTWDETQSPQWKYLLQRESAVKRGNRRTAARIRREESEKNELKFERINSELKKEQQKNNNDTRSTTQLSTESKE